MNLDVVSGYVLHPAMTMRSWKMTNELENRMVVDSEWDEIEYRIPNKNRIKRLRQACEEAERGDKENEYII